MESSKILLKDGQMVDLVDDRIADGDIASWNSKMDRQSAGNASEPVYIENGIAKIATNVATTGNLEAKLNVDGSNATTAGVTAMMKQVASGSADLNDDSSYFGDSNSDHTHIVRRPILNLWNYFAPKVANKIVDKLGSVGSADKPIYLENGVPKVCSDGVPYSSVNYGGSVGYGVYVGGITNLANTTISYCSFLVSVFSDPDKIDNTYIGTFTFKGKTLKSELRCLTGTPKYPLRIVVIYNKEGGTTQEPSYIVGLYVIPATKTYKYSSYKFTRLAYSNFIWAVQANNSETYDACDAASRNVFMTQTAMIKDVATKSTTDSNPIHIYYDDIICNNGTTAYTINISRLVIGKTYRFHIMKESQAATYLCNYVESGLGTVTIYHGDKVIGVSKGAKFALNGKGTGNSDHTVTVARMTETQIYVIWGY